VNHSLRDSVGVHIRRREAVRFHRKRCDASHAFPIEHESVRRKLRRSGGTDVRQICVEKCLDARIGGAQAVPQKIILLEIIAQQGAGNFQKIRSRGAAAGRLAESSQLEIDITIEFLVSRMRLLGKALQNDGLAGTVRGPDSSSLLQAMETITFEEGMGR
jgi:hypothetical protein